ncbi:hypothetical protein C8D88_108283 [Lentzea atacamensis]|uniref:Uncharacterized protein n=2 Tax=Lentzea TaxID=165301 RepID=A0A316HW42_9PSEU|nr:hypothetical protein [Lentzea atacamensis]PWK84667.1 hypothetical protein C8D88_108283 [Lentzea atacamensis]RAS59168.1 hypothetical protein C8D87_11527 [Lentzea atacamensis]
MEQTDFLLPDGEHDLLRRIRQLAERAERTAHNRSNLVGPPPSQEHLDILAEIRKLTEEMTTGRRAEVLPRPARPADDLIGERW